MKRLVLLLLAAVLSPHAAAVARAESVVVAPAEEASFPFFCDWGYDWDERCFWDTWSERLSIGGDRERVWRAGLRFPLGAVPAGSAVARAWLLLYYDKLCVGLDLRTVPCDGRRWDLEVVPIAGEWFDEREPDVGFPMGWHTLRAGAAVGWMRIDVTELVAEWVEGARANDGLLVKLVDAQEAHVGSGPKPPGRLSPTASLRPRLDLEVLPPP